MTELFGNGRSSPSNTSSRSRPALPVDDHPRQRGGGPPVLEDGLGIHHLKAVVGFSMGAEQAFQGPSAIPGSPTERRHHQHRSLLAARHRPARGHPRHHRRPSVQRRRLHRRARARSRDHGRRLARLALLAGVVEAEAEDDRPEAAGITLAQSRRLRRRSSSPAPTQTI